MPLSEGGICHDTVLAAQGDVVRQAARPGAAAHPADDGAEDRPLGRPAEVPAHQHSALWVSMHCRPLTTANLSAIFACSGSSSQTSTPGTLVAIGLNSPRDFGRGVGLQVVHVEVRRPARQVDHDDRLGRRLRSPPPPAARSTSASVRPPTASDPMAKNLAAKPPSHQWYLAPGKNNMERSRKAEEAGNERGMLNAAVVWWRCARENGMSSGVAFDRMCCEACPRRGGAITLALIESDGVLSPRAGRFV